MVNSAIGYPHAGCSALTVASAVVACNRPKVDAPFSGGLHVLSHLVPPAGAAVPITPVTPESLSRQREARGAAAQRWAEASGFRAQPGKTLLLPAPDGALARVLVGVKQDE